MGGCLSSIDNVVNDIVDHQYSFHKESKLAKDHLKNNKYGHGHNNTSHINSVLQSGLSPIYPSLPMGAKKHRVRNVYDGDTLTLIENDMRVRLVGIDTPEVKDKQAFAQEAKEYTKKYCHGKDVWLTFEAEQGGGGNNSNSKESTDHYGRLLAFVWVPLGDNNKVNNGGGGNNRGKSPTRTNNNSSSEPSQWLCINEGLVASGLAHVYAVGKKVHNHDKLLGLQRIARLHKCGQWSTFVDYKVIVTPNGNAFHKCKNQKTTINECKHLSRSKNLNLLLASEAYDKGLNPCRNCYG